MTTNERVTNVDGILFALSFEVVLLQLDILEGCTDSRNYHQKPTKRMEQLQREKLATDRETVKDIIRRTLIEILETGEYRTLQTATEYLKQRESSAINKRIDLEKLTISLEKIIEELNTKRIKWEAALLSMDRKVPVLRDRMNDDYFNVNARLRYAEKWLQARVESLDLQYNVERPIVPRVDHEHRVHKELLEIYKLQTTELEHSLKCWQQQYFADISKIKEKIKFQIEQLSATTTYRIELKKKYDLHEGEMRGWLTFKRERAARLAREERHRTSAVRIQAWWRGIMVRRALGAFKNLRNAKKTANKSKKKEPLSIVLTTAFTLWI